MADDDVIHVELTEDPVLANRILKHAILESEILSDARRMNGAATELAALLVFVLIVIAVPCLGDGVPFVLSLGFDIPLHKAERIVLIASVSIVTVVGFLLFRKHARAGIKSEIERAREHPGVRIITSGHIELGNETLRGHSDTLDHEIDLADIHHVALQFNAVIILSRDDSRTTAVAIHRRCFDDENHLRRFSRTLMDRIENCGRDISVRHHEICLKCGYDLHGMRLRCTECGTSIPIQWDN